MTPVEERLRRRIALTGPLTVADYMAACISDRDGYYASKSPFGAAGDFITAPEISQMFGELVGAWLADRWRADGAPECTLCELGPGRGTLMADILRVAGRDPDFASASRVVLVEASERLRKAQRERLAASHPRIEFAAKPPTDRPLYLVANEFFDALPIHQFVRRSCRWFERTVGLRDDALAFGLSPFPAALTADAPDGAVRELCPVGEAIIGDVARAIATAGQGAALIIDYGYALAPGSDTLSAVHRHRHVEVLAEPGAVDLSAHVDFAALAKAAGAEGASAHGPVGQGPFLLSLGLLERAGQLGAGRSAEEQQALREAVERLAGEGPGQMGALFKVLGVTAGERTPPGFQVVADEGGC